MRQMHVESLERRQLLTSISGMLPAANSNAAPSDGSVRVTFDQQVNPDSVSSASFQVVGQHSGRFNLSPDSFSIDNSELTVRLPTALHAGESVELSATSSLASVSNDPVKPSVWRWRSEATAGSGHFASTRVFGHLSSSDVSIADLNGNHLLDAVTVSAEGFEILLHAGQSGLQHVGTRRTEVFSLAIQTADFDGDHDTDVVVAGLGSDEIWLNDGEGYFSRGNLLGTSDTYDVLAGDVDGDGDADLVTIGASGDFDNLVSEVAIWINDGTASFSRVPLAHEPFALEGELGDVDGDLDLDLILVGDGVSVWRNQENGIWERGFHSEVGQFGSVSVADLDDDGDLDCFLVGRDADTNGGSAWINDGTGDFELFDFHAEDWADSVELGDVDADGDVDAVVSGTGFFEENHVHAVWINQGDGSFQPTTRNLSSLPVVKSALADLDGDGDLDMFVGTDLGDEIWLNVDTQVDLQVVITNGQQGFAEGSDSISYRLSVTNVGVDDALGTSIVANFTNAQEIAWTCSGPPTCAAAGQGELSDTIDLAAGATVNYFVNVTPVDASEAIAASAEAAIHEGDPDLRPEDNSSVDVDRPTQITLTPANGSITAGTPLDLIVSRSAADLMDSDGARLNLHGSQSGARTIAGDTQWTSRQVSFNTPAFRAGELVHATLNGLQTSDAGPLEPRVWQFHQAATQGTGRFGLETPLPMAVFEATNVSMGDLNGDGHLDLFSFSSDESNVWLSDGKGRFFDGGHNLAADLFYFSSDAQLGDFDADGDLDVIAVTDDGSQVWSNNGQALFTVVATLDEAGDSVALGDVDGDGDLDAFVGGFEETFVLVNDAGQFAKAKPKRPIDAIGVDDTQLADVDGDGDLDALLLFQFEGRAEIWLNDGRGDFLFETRIDVFSSSAGFADIDLDGDLDLVFVDRVMLNDGLGGYQNQVLLPAADLYAAHVTTGDVDGDGDSDIVVDGDVWLNQSGAFTKVPATSRSSLEVVAQELGDIDADGDLDLVVAGEDGIRLRLNADVAGDVKMSLARDVDQFAVNTETEVRYLLTVMNDGPALAEGIDITTDIPPQLTNVSWRCLSAEQVCGSSGQADLRDTISLAPGQRVEYAITGTLAAAEKGYVAVTASAEWPHGQQDIAPSNNVATDVAYVGAVTVMPHQLTTDGSGISGFQVNRPSGDLDPMTGAELVVHRTRSGVMPPTDTTISVSEIRRALDGSLHPGELIQTTLTRQTKTSSGAEVGPRVWESRVPVLAGTGMFGEVVRFGFPDGDTTSVRIGDGDGDGDLDVFLADNVGVTVWLNEGGFDFTFHSSISVPSLSNLELGDLNNDGHIDIAVLTNDPQRGLLAFLNNGTAVFESNGQTLAGTEGLDLELADVDGDGDLDALTDTGTRTRLWLNTGSGQFAAHRQVLSSVFGGVSQFADVDADGDYDVIARELGGFQIRVNDGFGNMSDGFPTEQGWRPADNMAPGDIDDDGDVDIASVVGGFTQIWRNRGDGTFVDSGQRLPTADRTIRFQFGDLDADGDLDLIGDEVWLNDGNGAFERGTGAPAGLVELGDIDGDGDLDAVDIESGFAIVYANIDVLTDVIVELDGEPELFAGEETEFTIEVRNEGPVALAGVAVLGPTDYLQDETWTCLAEGGSSCTSSGTGLLLDFVDLEPDSRITYRLAGTVKSSLGGVLNPSASVLLPDERLDMVLDNNQSEFTQLVRALVVAPLANSQDSPRDVRVVVDRPQADIAPASVSPSSFVIHRSSGGQEVDLGERLNVREDQIAVEAPNEGYFAGELIQLTATQQIAGAEGDALFPPFVWQVRVGTDPSSGTLVHRPHPALDDPRAVGDVDRDGDLDLIVDGAVWLNDGEARFTETTKTMSDRDTSLGDIDGDGDLDAIVDGDIWLNDGEGLYVDSGRRVSGSVRGMLLGDLDGDGDLDAVAITRARGAVYFNDGSGVFGDRQQELPGDAMGAGDLGDVDGDGDLDVMLAAADGNHTWLNDGSGSFELFDSTFGLAERPEAVRLGDLDGDGVLDAVVVGRYWNYVLTNTGNGEFFESDYLGEGGTGVEIADVNGDGRLDAVISGRGQSDILMNDEFGLLTPTGQLLPASTAPPIVGDFDGDGDIDLIHAEMLWLNDGAIVGDTDGDGAVNFADFLILASNFGLADASFADGDFDGDGMVAFGDFLLLAENFARAAARDQSSAELSGGEHW